MCSRPISDYSNFDYKTEYWIKANRDYENRCEHQLVTDLLNALSPISTLVDIGGGFGRLASVYIPRAKTPFLLDFALHQLIDARQTHGDRLNCITANFYFLPFQSGSVDVALTVRTLHHVVELPAFIAEIARIVKPGGHFIFEIPNQRHWIQILRYWLRRDTRNPFSDAPIVRGETFYNYHPRYVTHLLAAHGFTVTEMRSTSFFRSSLLKRLIPNSGLFYLDRICQRLFSSFWLTPSIFCSSVRK